MIGPLKATQQEPFDGQPNRLAEHKHSIRRRFHLQLKQLWATNRFLRDHQVGDNGVVDPDAVYGGLMRSDDCKIMSLSEAVARNYVEFGYRFVPIVRERLSLLRSLDVLFLRRDYPGSVISAGDLDNPFFCLLEDDGQVTRLVVESDILLEPKTRSAEDDARQVKLIINVEIKPYDVSHMT